MNDQEYLAMAGIKETESEGQAPETVSTEPQAQPAGEMFEIGNFKIPANSEARFTHDGGFQKVPLNTIINGYRQVAHLQQKHKTWNEERSVWEKQKAEYESAKAFKDKYGAIQEWSEKNPNDWKSLEEIWKNKDRHLLEARTMGQSQPLQGAQVGQQNNPNFKPFIDEMSQLKQDLSELKTFKQSFDQEQTSKREQEDTNYVLGQKDSFQKEYPEINLEERDMDGVALWAKVMRYGVNNHIPDFETAALKFLKPRLIDTISARARNEAVNGVKNDKRQGIIKRSSTPMTGQGEPKLPNPKNLSYAEIAEMFKNNPEQFASNN